MEKIVENLPTWLSGNLGYAALFAAFTTLGVVLGHLKSVMGWITGILIIRVSANGSVDLVLRQYLQQGRSFQSLKMKSFISKVMFVRPEKEYRVVAFDETLPFLFLLKWCPLFCSPNGDGGLIFSYIRGTLDFEKLVQEAYVDLHAKRKIATNRYRVHKLSSVQNISPLHVENPAEDISNSKSGKTRRGTHIDFNDLVIHRPIGYRQDELGQQNEPNPFLVFHESVQILLQDIDYWFTNRQWYEERNLEWRYGAALHGKPGSGKTSIVRNIGQKYDLPIYLIHVGGMSNEEFGRHWEHALRDTPCIVLIEDIDRLFDTDHEFKLDGNPYRNSLTLDFLLNCISGVEAVSGVLLFLTANDLSKIDTALIGKSENGMPTRPGRIDQIVEVGESDEAQRRAIAKTILRGYEADQIELVKQGLGDTCAQFTLRCTHRAQEIFWSQK